MIGLAVLRISPTLAMHHNSVDVDQSYANISFSEHGQPAGGVTSGVKIDVYVINLDDRPERCQCIAKQMENVGFGVFRQEGQKGNSCGLESSRTEVAKQDKADAEAGLFCSNYRIWKTAQKRDADYIIILEDDAVFSDGWESKVRAMLNSCQEVDYVNVDPVWWGSAMEPVSPESCAATPSLLLPVPDAWGTTMQIVRTGFLPKMIEAADQHGWGAMDIWYKKNPDGHQAYIWQPHIVQQISHQTWAMPWYCNQKTKTSDISNSLNLAKRTDGLWCPNHQG